MHPDNVGPQFSGIFDATGIDLRRMGLTHPELAAAVTRELATSRFVQPRHALARAVRERGASGINYGEELVAWPDRHGRLPIEPDRLLTGDELTSGTLVHMTSQSSAESILRHGFQPRGSGLGGEQWRIPNAVFAGQHGYDLMEYMGSQWRDLHPHEDPAFVRVRLSQ